MKKVINSKEESIFLDSLKDIVKSARKHAYSSICFAQVQSNWLLGKRIVEQIQKGTDKAEYGKHILKIASESLTEEFGKGYDESNLRYMRLFYKTFPICDALRHELSWTHYRRLLSVENQEARLWYMNDAANSVWSTRQLDRQISTYVLIDLKLGKLTHQDVGQMDSYIRMFDALTKQDDDNPTIGLILCSEKNEAIAKYSVLNDAKQIFASKYKLTLPTEDELQNELNKARKRLELETME